MSTRGPGERRHRRFIAALVAAIAAVAGAAVAIGIGYAVGGGRSDEAAVASTATQPRASAPGTSSTVATATAPVRTTTTPTAPAPATRPVVWVQAGHVPPGEPGYMAQTGAAGEAEFNTRTRNALITALRAAGIDAQGIGARVEPLGSEGAAFVSVHHDAPGGPAAIGYAVQGTENYYHGEGTGEASPTPYADSAPHRTPATKVTPQVQAASKSLAEAVATSFRRVYVPANGANGTFRGVESPNGNRRMMHFYGYYRTNAAARILIECGAPGADDAFLAQPELIGRAIARGVVDYLDSTSGTSASATSEVPAVPEAESSGSGAADKPVLPRKGA